MEILKNYRILIRKSNLENTYLNSFTKIVNIHINEIALCSLEIKYIRDENIYLKKDVLNFIDFSHFAAGIKLAGIYYNEMEIDFVDEVRELNLKFNPISNLENPILFAIMADKDMCESKMNEYNFKYGTDFNLNENYQSEGEQFCVIKLSLGKILDIFCFGLYYLLSQKTAHNSGFAQ